MNEEELFDLGQSFDDESGENANQSASEANWELYNYLMSVDFIDPNIDSEIIEDPKEYQKQVIEKIYERAPVLFRTAKVRSVKMLIKVLSKYFTKTKILDMFSRCASLMMRGANKTEKAMEFFVGKYGQEYIDYISSSATSLLSVTEDDFMILYNQLLSLSDGENPFMDREEVDEYMSDFKQIGWVLFYLKSKLENNVSSVIQILRREYSDGEVKAIMSRSYLLFAKDADLFIQLFSKAYKELPLDAYKLFKERFFQCPDMVIKATTQFNGPESRIKTQRFQFSRRGRNSMKLKSQKVGDYSSSELVCSRRQERSARQIIDMFLKSLGSEMKENFTVHDDEQDEYNKAFAAIYRYDNKIKVLEEHAGLCKKLLSLGLSTNHVKMFTLLRMVPTLNLKLQECRSQSIDEIFYKNDLNDCLYVTIPALLDSVFPGITKQIVSEQSIDRFYKFSDRVIFDIQALAKEKKLPKFKELGLFCMGLPSNRRGHSTPPEIFKMRNNFISAYSQVLIKRKAAEQQTIEAKANNNIQIGQVEKLQAEQARELADIDAQIKLLMAKKHDLELQQKALSEKKEALKEESAKLDNRMNKEIDKIK